MRHGRTAGLALTVATGVTVTMLLGAPAALAATGDAEAIGSSSGAAQLVVADDGDTYRDGFRDGYRRGYDDGLNDAKDNCQEDAQKRFAPKSQSDYERGIADGYPKGYTAGYQFGYDNFCDD